MNVTETALLQAPLLADVTVDYNATLRTVNVRAPAGYVFITIERVRSVHCDCGLTYDDMLVVVNELERLYRQFSCYFLCLGCYGHVFHTYLLYVVYKRFVYMCTYTYTCTLKCTYMYLMCCS